MLAILVGTVQGGSQALSPLALRAHDPAPAVVGVLRLLRACSRSSPASSGPAIFAYAVGQTGSSRIAILSIVVFFIIGAILLAMVNVREGERFARQAELEAGAA